MPQYPTIGVHRFGRTGGSQSDVAAVQKSPAARRCNAMMASCSSVELACELAPRGGIGSARERSDHSGMSSIASSRWIMPSSESSDAVSEDLGEDKAEDSVGHGERVAMRQLALDGGDMKTVSSIDGVELTLLKQTQSTWCQCAWCSPLECLPVGVDSECERGALNQSFTSSTGAWITLAYLHIMACDGTGSISSKAWSIDRARGCMI